MLNIPDNVRHDIIRLVPMSVINDIVCFVYYDNHPRDTKCVDIVICTKRGEVKEYFQRQVVSEVYLESIKPLEIKIIRNSSCELFYLVAAEDQLIILSRKDKLYVHRKVTNVERYDVDDSICQGQACLKIIRKDDAVPLILDDKFESLGDGALLLSSIHTEETLPVLTELNRKLIEAKYSVKCNENTYKELSNLRQLAAFTMYQKIHPNLEESVFKSGSKQMADAVKIKTEAPWVKTCNEKIVIVLNIVNNNEDPMENVHMLIHAKNRSSMVYTTKIYKRITKSPYWEEKKTQSIEKNEEVAVLTVINLKELKENVASRLDFNGVLVYKKIEKEHILPFDRVSLSALDSMGEDFDVLSTSQIDFYAILAVLATTEKIDLLLRHLAKDGDPKLNFLSIFCSYLQMEQVQISDNIVIHRKSPYHPLNGVMIVFTETSNGFSSKTSCETFSIHARRPSQVQAFIHFIHDAVPHKLVITAVNHKLVSKVDEFSKYNEEITSTIPSETGYMDYASSMLNRSRMLIEHLDTCMVRMNDSKVPEVQRKIGSEIDLFAAGVSEYVEFRSRMLNEEYRGLQQLHNTGHQSEIADETMVVDNS